MWSGITIDTSELVSNAVSFYNLFEPIVYFVGGIIIGTLILRIVISLFKRA